MQLSNDPKMFETILQPQKFCILLRYTTKEEIFYGLDKQEAKELIEELQYWIDYKW